MKNVTLNILACLDSIMSAINKKDLPMEDKLLIKEKLHEGISKLGLSVKEEQRCI